MNALQIERDRLERAYNDAIAARKGAQADLDRLKSEPDGGASNKPIDPAANDAQLARMNKEAQLLTTKLSASHADHVAAAQQARKALDAAGEQLQKEIDAAQPLITGQNTELSAYVSAAQNFQSAIGEITEESVQRRQQQYATLNDLQAKRDQKIQARRSELWANDVQLR